MSKQNKPSAPSAVAVRKWAEEKGLIKAGQRGRLGTGVIDAYNAEQPSRSAKYPVTYRPKAEAKIKHTVVVERNGKKVPVTRSLPKSQVRALAVTGGFGARGTLSKAALDYAFTNAPK